MGETNSLTLKVKSDSVKTGSERLDQLKKAAIGAERSAQRLSATQTGAAASSARAATATGANVTATGSLASSQTAAAATTTRLATAQNVNAAATTRNATATAAGATATGSLATAQAGATATTRTLSVAGKGLIATFSTMLAPLLAILAPLAAMNKLFNSAVSLQDYEARLKTATGSVETAGVAFEALEGFASQTPFALEQSLEAFLKLKNLGLNPTEEALISYGNTASAKGKELTQIIEAVADATNGEFERLKEAFDITSKTVGDRVRFTFQGITTEVGKNAEEIEAYLQSIGNNNFAGAMTDRMATLGGQVSNLGDAWGELFRTISEMGVGEVMGQSISWATGILKEFIAQLESGQFENTLKSWTAGLEGWASDFQAITTGIADFFSGIAQAMGIEGAGTWAVIIQYAKLMPAAIRSIIQKSAANVAALGLSGVAAGKGIYKGIIAGLKATLQAVNSTVLKIGAALSNPIETFKKGGVDLGLSESLGDISGAVRGEIAAAKAEISAIGEARDSVVAGIEAEFDAVVSSVQAYESLAKSKRKAYDVKPTASLNDVKINRPSGGGASGGASATSGGSGGSGGGSGRSASGATGGSRSSAPSGPSEFEKLKEELLKEEKAIEDSYLKRLELVRKNTKAGSELRAELEEKLQETYFEDVEKFAEKTVSEIDIAKNGFDLKLGELQTYYDNRKQLILDNEQLTEEEKTGLVAGLTQERNDLVRQMTVESAKQGLALADNYFKNFTGLAESSNKKLAAVGKAALVAQKAVAITQATIKTYESATSAYASLAGIPIVGPALGAAAAGAAIAAGLANVSSIASAPTNVGNFASGGILGGSSGTGDAVTFNGNRGEAIINLEQQRRLLNIANGAAAAGQGNGGSGNVTIINQTSTPVEAEARTTANGDREIIIREAVNRTKSELANEASAGGGTVVPALQRSFGLRRTGT